MTDKYYKQTGLFDPEKAQPQIYVYGAGSIGSHVTVGLAKTGFRNITVYDFDEVEAGNIPAQFYREKDIGKQKTTAIKEIVEEFIGEDIVEEVNQELTPEFSPELDIDSIHILAFDNIEARKMIAEKLRGFPVYIVDGRIGGFNYEKYILKAEDQNFDEYLKTFEGNFSEEVCNEKCLWTVNTTLASKIITDIIKIGNQETNRINYSFLSNILTDKNIIVQQNIKRD